MLTETYYVPILRWKQAEWLALRRLDQDTREHIMPLLEIPPSRFPPTKSKPEVDIRERLIDIVDQIGRSWGQQPFFLDLALLDPGLVQRGLGKNMLSTLGDMCVDSNLVMTPVTGIHRGDDYQHAVRGTLDHFKEVAIRIDSSELARRGIENEIFALLTFLDLPPSRTHLIVDFGFINETPAGYLTKAKTVPMPGEWRSLVFSGGAFPVDLQDIDIGVQETWRFDWLSWSSEIVRQRGNIARTPTYSDYTIQHPGFAEPPEWANPSASIRYATETTWLIFRGEGLRTSDLGYEQYIGHAILLYDNDRYYGEEFSYGDAYIEEIANKQQKTGSPMSWLSAGVNHHITLVTRQIASLLD